jgi:hypothetical protein
MDVDAIVSVAPVGLVAPAGVAVAVEVTVMVRVFVKVAAVFAVFVGGEALTCEGVMLGDEVLLSCSWLLTLLPDVTMVVFVVVVVWSTVTVAVACQ